MAWVQSSSLVGGRWMLESGFCWWENLLLTYDFYVIEIMIAPKQN